MATSHAAKKKKMPAFMWHSMAKNDCATAVVSRNSHLVVVLALLDEAVWRLGEEDRADGEEEALQEGVHRRDAACTTNSRTSLMASSSTMRYGAAAYNL
uniref:Uncharacterized protein n=1 Tax=Oryza punctata TaxID=4537 RepID=A0A0E0LGU4_ORYPU